MTSRGLSLRQLISQVRACRLCETHLPLGPRPVLRASKTARLLIIGQAPGTRVHASGIPWDDASGRRLRQWLDIDESTFYDEGLVAIMPMGFCYPGKGRGGDLPPRPECAPAWHGQILEHLPAVALTLLIGSYAQHYYLPETRRLTLTERVRNQTVSESENLCLVHPSPRNVRWLQRNPWFEGEFVPVLRKRVHDLLF